MLRRTSIDEYILFWKPHHIIFSFLFIGTKFLNACYHSLSYHRIISINVKKITTSLCLSSHTVTLNMLHYIQWKNTTTSIAYCIKAASKMLTKYTNWIDLLVLECSSLESKPSWIRLHCPLKFSSCKYYKKCWDVLDDFVKILQTLPKII